MTIPIKDAIETGDPRYRLATVGQQAQGLARQTPQELAARGGAGAACTGCQGGQTEPKGCHTKGHYGFRGSCNQLAVEASITAPSQVPQDARRLYLEEEAASHVAVQYHFSANDLFDMATQDKSPVAVEEPAKPATRSSLRNSVAPEVKLAIEECIKPAAPSSRHKSVAPEVEAPVAVKEPAKLAASNFHRKSAAPKVEAQAAVEEPTKPAVCQSRKSVAPEVEAIVVEEPAKPAARNLRCKSVIAEVEAVAVEKPAKLGAWNSRRKAAEVETLVAVEEVKKRTKRRKTAVEVKVVKSATEIEAPVAVKELAKPAARGSRRTSVVAEVKAPDGPRSLLCY